jgi:SAM-dependent methyltransferase
MFGRTVAGDGIKGAKRPGPVLVADPGRGELPVIEFDGAHREWLLFGGLRMLKDLLAYRRAKSELAAASEECRGLFGRFLAANALGPCLRLVFDAGRADRVGPRLGPNWVTLDLASVERESREPSSLTIDLEDEYFDAVLLSGLERVSRAGRLVAELRRVLKRGGQIWVEAPLNAPYRPAGRSTPAEYWRIAPDGLRLLMEGFDEILCSVFLPGDSALRSCSFFYGLKPATDGADPPELP